MILTKDGKIQSNKPEAPNNIDDRNQYLYELEQSNIEDNNIDPIYMNPKKHKIKKTKHKKKKGHIIVKIIKAILIIIIMLMTIVIAAGGAIAFKIYDIVKDVKLDKEDVLVHYEDSVVKDSSGNTLAVLNGDENRISVSLEEMAEYLPMAFVAIEDERFYEHNGIDIQRTLMATYTYVTNKGKSSFGGSSITQQLVKNVTQETEDTWERKVREMARAYCLEQEMSKEEILELYLNLIFLGDIVYGVEQGSNYYFSKSAKDLSLAECAFLAGINHQPNVYNPFVKDNENTLKNINIRTKTVLNKMNELGYIKTEEEYNQALKEVDEGLKFNKGAKSQVLFSYHTDAALNQIISELQAAHNWTYEQARLYLFGGGFTIYTTQDPVIQEKMQAEFNQEKYRRIDIDIHGNPQKTQASMVLIENGTGRVLAICNGFEEKNTAFGFNIAVDAKKQTGSSMKTISALAPAIDRGIITASTVFDDSPTTFNNGKYNPKNYGNSYRGLITVREAIEHSQNIPMLKTMTLLTPSESIKFLKSVGITSLDDEKDNVLSLALGGLTWGVTPLEMAGAYSAIENNGVYIKPTFYTKVTDSSGNIIIEPNQEGRKVMSAEAAYVVKQILTQPVKTGTSKICAIGDMDVSAKTGTSNNDYDRWLCGFTPYYTAAVWYGHDTNATVSGWSYSPASQIWSGVMHSVHEGLEVRKFDETRPSNIVEVNVCKKSGFLATSYCKSSRTAYTEYFVAGTEPVQNCPYHSYAKVCTASGLLANSNCPKTRSVSGRGEYIGGNTNLWKTTSSYRKITNIPTQVCRIH